MRDFESGSLPPDPSDSPADPPMDEIVREYNEYTSFSSSVSGTILRVRTIGEVDFYSVPVMRQLIDEQLVGHSEVVQAEIDLTQTSYIDSTVLGVLVGLAKKLKERNQEFGQRIRVLSPDVNISAIFRVSGLTAVFEVIEPSEEDYKQN